MTNEEKRMIKRVKRQPIRQIFSVNTGIITEKQATEYIKNLRKRWSKNDGK